MWRQAKVMVGDVAADQAMVSFEGKSDNALFLEWPHPLTLNAEIMIGEGVYYAISSRACAGRFEIDLGGAPLLPVQDSPEFGPAPELPASLVPEPALATDPETPDMSEEDIYS